MYAYCIIEYPVKTLDKAFTYKIPSEFKRKIKSWHESSSSV